MVTHTPAIHMFAQQLIKYTLLNPFINIGDYSFNDPQRSDTPNLQVLAEKGMIMTDFHAGASVCTPSRASLMTGRLGLRTGVTGNFSPDSVFGLPLNETTIAEVLHGVGYATVMTGKWHLGHNPPYGPVHRGFDRFLGTPLSHDYGCTNHPGYDGDCPHRDQDVCLPSDPSLADGESCHIGPNNPFNESIPLMDGDDVIEQPVDLTTLSDRYVDFALDFIANTTSKDDSQPFFVYMPFNHMHVPVGNHRPEFTNRSVDRGVYGDTLLQLDHSIGRFIQTLEKQGLAENTLVVLTGDNGAPDGQGAYGGLNDPFLGKWLKQGSTGKTTTWEGGHREPGLAIWPG